MTVTAADLMTTPAITVDPGASVGQVAEMLVDKGISALPVCKPDGSLAGIISELDIMRPFREAMRRKRDRWLGLIAEGEALSPDFLEYLKTDTKLASDLMARHVVTAGPGATLPELAELMVEHGVKRIPIVDRNRLVGIVSRSDVLRAISKTPEQAL